MSYTFRRMIAVILIALVIAALIIGLVLFVKSRGEIARRGVETNKTTQVGTDSGSKTTTGGTNTTTVTSPGATTSTNKTNTSTTSGNTTTNSSKLPVTGPADDISAIVAIGALTLSLGYYVQSVRARRSRAALSHL